MQSSSLEVLRVLGLSQLHFNHSDAREGARPRSVPRGFLLLFSNFFLRHRREWFCSSVANPMGGQRFSVDRVQRFGYFLCVSLSVHSSRRGRRSHGRSDAGMRNRRWSAMAGRKVQPRSLARLMRWANARWQMRTVEVSDKLVASNDGPDSASSANNDHRKRSDRGTQNNSRSSSRLNFFAQLEWSSPGNESRLFSCGILLWKAAPARIPTDRSHRAVGIS